MGKKLGGALAALALSLGVAAPTSAEQAPGDPIAELSLVSGTQTTTFVDEGCLDVLDEAYSTKEARDLCTFTMTATVSDAEPVTSKSLANDPSLTAAERAEIGALAAVSSKHYSNFITGGVYTTTQEGTFYYNGSRVWVTQPYLGYSGSQSCFANYAVPPWSVSNFSKSDSGSTTTRTVRCDFDVNQAGIIVTHRALVAKPTASGSVTYQVSQ